jgi:hypothetical protein
LDLTLKNDFIFYPVYPVMKFGVSAEQFTKGKRVRMGNVGERVDEHNTAHADNKGQRDGLLRIPDLAR